MKKHLLTKMLLVATGLLAGTSAWADEVTETYDFNTWGMANGGKGTTWTITWNSTPAFQVNENDLYVLDDVVKDENTLVLNGRIAISNPGTSSDKNIVYRCGSGATNVPNIGSLSNKVTGYFAVCDLNEGDRVTLTGTGSFKSANATYLVDGVATAIAVDGALSSGTQYTMTADGPLTFILQLGKPSARLLLPAQ